MEYERRKNNKDFMKSSLKIILLFIGLIQLSLASLPKCKSCKSYQFCLDGKCKDNCAKIRCIAGTKCLKGQCIPIDKCQSVKCTKNYQCKEGECVKIDLCKSTKCTAGYHCEEGKCVVDKKPKQCGFNNNQIYCKDPRPTLATCPQVNFIRAPDDVVCGVDKDGKKQGYPLECYACRDTKNIFYYDVPCNQLNQTKCPVNKECVNEKCIDAIDQCSNKCLDWQFCSKGECRDRCEFMKCANCFRGQCGVIDKCSVVKCQNGLVCADGNCVKYDKCAATTCPVGSSCNDGVCHSPLEKCDSNVKCAAGSTCRYGMCFKY